MIREEQIKFDADNRVRCYYLIMKQSDRHFGTQCNNMLMQANRNGEVAGKVKCSRCKAVYEFVDGKQILIKRHKVSRHNKNKSNSKEAIR